MNQNQQWDRRGFISRWAMLFVAITAAEASAADAKLADAVQTRDTELARRLLAQGVDVDVPQADGMTALHWAVHFDDVQLAGRLVAAGADVEARTRYGVPPLMLAATNGHAGIVDLLLDAGADANTTLRGGETALMRAARTGKPGPVKSLIAHGANVNATERRGQFALMWAAAEGNVEVVDELIQAGADVQAELKSGFTAFFFAVREGRKQTVFRLLEAGLDVNGVMSPKTSPASGPRKGTSALILAVENGHFELAAALLDAGADANDQRAGFAALHAITWVRKPLRGDGDPPPIGSGSLSSLDFVRSLVSQGANVNARHGKHKAGNALNKTGATPFLLAAETGDVPLMTLLLELGADPDVQNADGVTPLLAAAGVGILSNGDESAGTEEDAIAAIRLLLERGADVNAVDEHGETAMHGAAYKSWTNLVEFLADSAADIAVWNKQNRHGWTPLLIAQGHRPGNFRPSPETIVAIEQLIRATGNTPAN